MPLKHSRDIKEITTELRKFAGDMPRIAGVEAVKFFKQSFRKQGWHDKALVKWNDRKNPRDRGRAILVKSGRLRRSPRVIKQNKRMVRVSSNVIYAQPHNEGNTSRGLVRRKFMGNSKALNKTLKKAFDKRLKRIIR